MIKKKTYLKKNNNNHQHTIQLNTLVKNQLNQTHPKEKERDPYKCTTRNDKKDRKFETKNSPVHEQKK
jgi:hypothetical protein